ncbi:MAG: translation initiation factor IF-2, partial [Clostridia bacterium]|nr:translation initiation factor IF-2 [Clostridia bacterium]
LDKKRIELTIKRELCLRAEEEKLRKAEMAARPQNAQEQISVEAGGQDNETAAQERSEDEKAIVAQSTENIVPLVTEPATVRRVEPVRTAEKPVVKTGEKTEEKTATDTKDFKKKPPVVQEKAKVKDDHRNLSKKAKIKKGYEQGSSSVLYDDSGEIRKIRTRKAGGDRRRSFTPITTVIDHAVINTENITIKQLSEKIGKTGAEIMKKLIDLGIFKNINDTIDFDTAELISSEFHITLEKQVSLTSEEKLISLYDDESEDDASKLVPRPPIVTIMGHVDHGKTSVLDYIRHANVASGEAGGITQHIGAYTITLNGSQITFIDTPGHEAFTAMRARGANVTDIVVIVVAADDGVMPQTIEAINHAKAAGVAVIVAINKMDKNQANPDRVLQQLSDHNVLVEDWGGDVPAIKVSAKSGLGIKELLENILTVAEVLELKANPDRTAKGTIIESKLDKGKGPVATILVQTGSLKVSDFIVAGTSIGKIRAMFDDKGRKVAKATPSMAVSILGLQSVPNAGDQIIVVEDEKLSKEVAEERKIKEKIDKLKPKAAATIEDAMKKLAEGRFKDRNLIIKADVQGSIEALKQTLLRLSNDEVRVTVIHDGVGAISESDIMLAKTSDSIIVGFNIRPDANARLLADKNGVDIRLYRIIYDVIDDITKEIKGMLAPVFKESYLGRAEVRIVYKVSGVGTVAGCMVKDGKITRNAKARLIRDDKEVFDTEIASLKRFKDDAKEVAAGFECGIGLERYNDIKEGDIIEAYIVEEHNA